MVTSLGNNRRK